MSQPCRQMRALSMPSAPDPYPTPAPPVPMSAHPDRRGPRPDHPAATHPKPRMTAPGPIPRSPVIRRTGRRRNVLHLGRSRRRLCNHHRSGVRGSGRNRRCRWRRWRDCRRRGRHRRCRLWCLAFRTVQVLAVNVSTLLRPQRRIVIEHRREDRGGNAGIPQIKNVIRRQIERRLRALDVSGQHIIADPCLRQLDHFCNARGNIRRRPRYSNGRGGGRRIRTLAETRRRREGHQC
jgi:hypothetical protein